MNIQFLIINIATVIGLILELDHWFITYILLLILSVGFGVAITTYVYKAPYKELRLTLPESKLRNEVRFYTSLHMSLYVLILVT